MKKYLLIVLLVLLILTPISCNNKIIEVSPDELINVNSTQSIPHINSTEFEFTPNSDKATNNQSGELYALGLLQYYDDLLYLSAHGMVYRYDIRTGNVTSLCDDPLCSHSDEACPFFGIIPYGFHIYNNKIYYTQNYFSTKKDIFSEPETVNIGRFVMYDIENRKLKVIRNIPDGVLIESKYYHGNYLYYLNTLTDENGNHTFEICRQNLDNFNIESLIFLGSTPSAIAFINNDRIYLVSGVGLYYYSLSDFSTPHYIYKNDSVDLITDGVYFYVLVRNENGTNSLIRIDMDGNNPTKLCDDNVGYICSTEKYIYYRKNEKIVVGKDKFGNNIEIPDSNVYRVPKQGGNAVLVYSFPQNMKNYYIGRFIVDGIYLYANYGYYDEQNNTLYESIRIRPYDFIRINLKTGAIYYIYKEE